MMKRFHSFVVLGCALFLASSAAGGWEKLEHCRLIPEAFNDGDSFHVMHQGKEYIFRLYFVDTPEAEEQVPERVEEQAQYWGISESQVVQAGRDAARFTIGTLTGDFTVYTQWEDAMGSSQLRRYFALVIIRGKDLSELLTANGHARVYGGSVDRPDGISRGAFEARLDELARQAKARGLGVWGGKKGKVPDPEDTSTEPSHTTWEGGSYGTIPAAPPDQPAETAKQMVTVPGQVTAYSPQPPYKPIGYFPKGTELEIVNSLPESMILVKHKAPEGKVTFAACKYWELGLSASPDAAP